MRIIRPQGAPKATHSRNERDAPFSALELIYFTARMFCTDAIGVVRPPAFPDHARPKRMALMYGSSGSSERIMGSENERTSVVEAILERTVEILKLRSIIAKRTILGCGLIRERAATERRSVI